MRESSQKSERPILLLTNNSNTNPLYDWLLEEEPCVLRVEGVIGDELFARHPRFAVSFNYRHIISAEKIEALGCPIVNVHCSVLPWNRGAAPNFFSYYEGTPKGVTVHQLTAGLDKGGVILQSILPLDENETFESSYAKLIDCGIDLIKNNWVDLVNGRLDITPQSSGGSYHTVLDFEAIRSKYPFSWSERICDWKDRNGLE